MQRFNGTNFLLKYSSKYAIVLHHLQIDSEVLTPYREFLTYRHRLLLLNTIAPLDTILLRVQLVRYYDKVYEPAFYRHLRCISVI